EYAQTFKQILIGAKDENGHKIFTQAEVNSITGNKNENIMKVGQTPKSIFGDYLPRVNNALSSEYGKQVINQAYTQEINSRVSHIENFVGKINNPAAKEFYNSEPGKVLLFD